LKPVPQSSFFFFATNCHLCSFFFLETAFRTQVGFNTFVFSQSLFLPFFIKGYPLPVFFRHPPPPPPPSPQSLFIGHLIPLFVFPSGALTPSNETYVSAFTPLLGTFLSRWASGRANEHISFPGLLRLAAFWLLLAPWGWQGSPFVSPLTIFRVQSCRCSTALFYYVSPDILWSLLRF